MKTVLGSASYYFKYIYDVGIQSTSIKGYMQANII